MNSQNPRPKLIDSIGVPVEEHAVTAGNINTVYLEAGSGPPLVLLHGAGCGSVVWHRSMGSFSNHFRVIAPDIVGYGESDKPTAEYDRAFYVSWLEHFLSALELDSIFLVGSSQGGAIALQFAIDYPDRVKRLALVDSGGLDEKLSKKAVFYTLLMNIYPTKTVHRWVTKCLVHEKSSITDELSEYAIQVLRKPGGTRPFWDGQGKALRPVSDNELQNMHTETLIIWGEEDQFISSAHGVRGTELLPDAKFKRIPRAGHLPFLDRPFVFNDHLIDFFNA